MTERGQADLLIAIATSSDMTINHHRRKIKLKSMFEETKFLS